MPIQIFLGLFKIDVSFIENRKVMRGQVPSEAYIHFDMTLAMLNHSMGTLLRV